MKVAAVQFSPVFKDMAANINTMEGLVAEAAKAGADLVVLPEMATAGYSFMSEEDARPYSEDPQNPESPSFKAMLEASTALGVAIVWGYIEKTSAGLHNAQAMVLPQRGLVASYAKANPWGNDWLWAKPGRQSPPVVEWRGKKIGLLICRDIRDKSDSESDLYEPGDAHVIAFSANFGDGGFPATAWMDFVKNNKIPLAVSNRYGREQNNNFGEGGVCIIHPDGRIQCEGLKWSAPCIVYGSI